MKKKIEHFQPKKKHVHRVRVYGMRREWFREARDERLKEIKKLGELSKRAAVQFFPANEENDRKNRVGK